MQGGHYWGSLFGDCGSIRGEDPPSQPKSVSIRPGQALQTQPTRPRPSTNSKPRGDSPSPHPTGTPGPASIEISLWRPHPLGPLCPSQSFRKHRFLTVHSQPSLCSAAPQAGEPRLGPAHIVACILWPHRGKTQRGPVAQHLGYEGASGAEPWEEAPSTACHQY